MSGRRARAGTGRVAARARGSARPRRAGGARAGRALHGEWTKLVSVPGQLWLLAALAGSMVAVGVLVAWTQRPDCGGPAAAACPPPHAAALALPGVYVAQLAAITLGAALVSSEYQPRLIRLTLAAHPRRGPVFAAKLAVGAAAALAAAAAGVAGALVAARAVLGARGLHGPSGRPLVAFGDLPLLRAGAGTVLYLALVLLLAMGVAWTMRHGAAAAGTASALMYGPYVLTQIVPMPERVLHAVQDAAPMTAGLAVQATPARSGTASLGPWPGLGVLAAYAAAALALGWTLLARRDA